MKVDIHNFVKQVQTAANRVQSDVKLSNKNKKFVLEFVDHLVAEGISKPRVTKYIYTLRQWALWLNKDFDSVKKEDIAQVITRIQLQDHYAPWTRHTLKVMIRRFFQWLRKTGEDYPEEVKWLKSRISRSEQRLPGEGELLVRFNVEDSRGGMIVF